jgi:hypothetical protein
MMSKRIGSVVIQAHALVLIGAAILCAQDAPKPKSEPSPLIKLVEESVGWYRMFADANTTEPMTPHAALRWRNVTRGTQESEGMFVLWVNNGRPEASASIYPWEGNLVHDFVSLSRESKLVAREGRGVAWAPGTPGVVFKDIPNAPAPAETPNARLRQMKLLTDRFAVTMTGWKPDKSDREDLRMLPKPLYRAEGRPAPASDSSWIDSGVFGYVQGTDPEAILLLEAVRHDGKPRWQYGFARATAAGLEGRLDKAIVWAVDFLEGQPTSQKPQMTLRHPLPTAAAGPANR